MTIFPFASRLASLHMYQHALAANGPGSKVTVKTVEKEYGLERFVPPSLAESMKKKEMQKLLGHFLKLNSSLLGPGNFLAFQEELTSNLNQVFLNIVILRELISSFLSFQVRSS